MTEGVHRIVITDPVRLREAIHFAQRNNSEAEFATSFVRLLLTLTGDMVQSDGVTSAERSVTAELGRDFAPYSFSWCTYATDRPYERPRDAGPYGLVGGFIYHGPSSPGDGSFPALSVSLDWVAGKAPVHSWSIHT